MHSQRGSRITTKVIGVIVTYYPDLVSLARLLRALRDQVDSIIIVDNGSDADKALEKVLARFPNTVFVGLETNRGIAFAQNVGLRLAKSHNASHILTLDQDSIPPPNMVRVLANVFEQQPVNSKVAAVGPILMDETTQQFLPLFSYDRGYKRRIIPSACQGTIDVDFLVSSGTLISLKALIDIGLMREELFIAYVDVEWCLRAKSHNYRVIACCATTMEHNLGERRIKIGRWLLPIHSPTRHFYLLRSGMYMQRLPYITTLWKKADRRQLLRSFFLFSIAGIPSFEEVRHMYRGFRAGLSMEVVAFPTFIKTK